MRTGWAFAAVLLTSAAASADPADVHSCVEAHKAAQLLRNEGNILEARVRVEQCVADQCPAPVRKDCAQWSSELVKEQPSVVVTPRGPARRSLASVRVTLDGKPLEPKSLGRAVDVDPGEHRVRCELSDGSVAEQTTFVALGQKAVALDCTFPEVAPSPRVEKPTPPSTPAARLHPGMLVLGGVGFLGLGVFSYFGLTGLSKEHALEQDCMPHCAPSDIDGVRHRYLAADIALGVGLATLAAAVLWYALSPPARASSVPLQERTVERR